MQHEDEDLETLFKLGLTHLQAKIYLTLIKTGKATIKNISKASNVARQDVGRVTRELHELSLIKKAIAVPNEYEPIPLDEGITILLNRRKQETIALRENTSRLLQHFQVNNTENLHEIDPKFFIIPKREASIHQFIKALNNAQTSYDGVFFCDAVSLLPQVLDEPFEKFLRKGGKIRIIACKAENIGVLQKRTQAFRSKGSFEVRYTPRSLLATSSIFDGKAILVTNSTAAKPDDTTSLLSNSPNIVGLAVDYFEQVWNEASSIAYKKFANKRNRPHANSQNSS